MLMRHQRLLWVSEIQGLQFTVILDRERQAITVSQSGRDGTLQVTELNSVVKITVHCDLGSGTSGDNSLTVRKRRDFAGDGIE